MTVSDNFASVLRRCAAWFLPVYIFGFIFLLAAIESTDEGASRCVELSFHKSSCTASRADFRYHLVQPRIVVSQDKEQVETLDSCHLSVRDNVDDVVALRYGRKRRDQRR